jgi:AP endonuclease 2
VCFVLGVATFARDIATPLRAEGGLSGTCVEPASQRVAGFEHEDEFTKEELAKLDSEGRCVITEHCIVLVYNYMCVVCTCDVDLSY